MDCPGHLPTGFTFLGGSGPEARPVLVPG
jgi:hypothetical protein